MEEFSQSRGDDDLFDDEIVPIDSQPQATENVTAQLEQVALEPASTQPSKSTLPAQSAPPASRGRARGRGRGRGGQPRDNHKPSGLADSKYAPKASPAVQSDTPTPQASDKKEPSSPATAEPTPESAPQPDDAPPSTAPTGPSNPTAARPPAVRGDRTATGGVRKPKLTEEELSAKIAAAKERSQNLAAAHARAQADAENFAERERLATERRAKETEERKALQGERERNRERKLRALGGREWDAGKDQLESPNAFRGEPRPRRAEDFFNNGNDDANDLSIYEWNENRGRGGGRGRGRGRGGAGRGGGEGRNTHPKGRGAGGPPHVQTQPDIHAETDFPALPAKKVTSPLDKKPVPLRKSSEGPAGASWADQVESSEATKT